MSNKNNNILDISIESIESMMALFDEKNPPTNIENKLSTIPAVPQIYIAGKITGLPEDEVKQNFYNAFHGLRLMGYDAFNPYQHIIDIGYSVHNWETIMKVCITNLLLCDGIVMLHNWQESKGATLERTIANALNMPIFYPGDKINL